jgi:hypothetical protein
VTKRYSQIVDIDFKETFTPGAKSITIKCIFTIGAIVDLKIDKMDVKIAFLNGDLEEDIFMDHPNGFVQEGQEYILCKLKKTRVWVEVRLVWVEAISKGVV